MAEQTRGPNEPVPAGEALDENKLIAERRAKLAAIREKGIAYPNDFRRTHYAGDLQKDHSAATAEELEQQGIPVTVAGRMLGKRVSMGGGEHGFSVFVNADELIRGLDATVADISD